jgi:membrane-anchored glycerophosphoryl diester phosphodiesterase (GDPDase)
MSVSDDQQWKSPGGPSIPPVVPPAGSAPSGLPTVATAPTAPPGWTPPPKPGLIPLRPLDLGVILGASFRLLRRNPRPTFGVAVLIQSVVLVVGLGLIFLAAFYTTSRFDFSSSGNQSTISAGNTAILILAALVAVALSFISSAMLQGIIVLEVSRATLGEKQRLPQLWRRARGRIGALIGWTALVALAVTIALSLVVGLIIVLVSTLGTAGIVAGVLIGLFGGLGSVVLAFWLGTRLAFVASALMLERLTIRQAIVRSWTLTRGYFWRTLGILLLVSVILQVANSIISTPLNFLAQFLIPLVDPNRQTGPTTIILIAALGVLAVIVSLVFSAITAVVQTATTVLLYLDVRIRKEGLDLDLARFVEARQAGDATARDPYLPAPSA